MDNKILLLVLTTFLVTECKIPDYIQLCKASDPNLNECIKNSVYNLLPRLRVGIPEINVPAMEPLYIKNTSLNTGSGGVYIGSTLTDLLVWNASYFKFEETKNDIAKNRFEFNVLIPKLRIVGKYEMDTKILALRLTGKGPFNFNVTDLRIRGLLKGKRVVTNGIKHLKFDKVKLHMSIGSATIKLENLFNGDPALGKATNDVINDNVDVFYDTLKPAFESSLEETLTDIANKITDAFEYDELFPK